MIRPVQVLLAIGGNVLGVYFVDILNLVKNIKRSRNRKTSEDKFRGLNA